MIKSFRTAVLLTTVGLVVASAAMAGPPSEANSSKPACITLVQTIGGVPDSVVGRFIVIVRDLANNPLSGASVVIDLSQANDIAICNDQLDANALVNCAAKTVRKFTNIAGSVTFTVLGNSNGADNGTLLHGGRIYANGTLIGSPTVSAFDLDGNTGLGGNDLSVWLTDFGTGQNYGRSDFDCSDTIGANDVSMWLTVYGTRSWVSSCTPKCP